MGKLNWFVAGAVAGLTAAAISKELEKPAGERTWRGKIAGIPYNFNIPSWGELVHEYWNPDSNRIFSPHAIGLGWGINFAALIAWLQDTFGEPGGSQLPERSERPESVER